MCIEDIRIGRRRHSPPVIDAIGITNLPANARRVKLKVTTRQDWAISTVGGAVVYRTSEGGNFVIARCGYGFPQCELTLESDGIIVQDELSIAANGVANYNVLQVFLDDQEHSPVELDSRQNELARK